MSELKAEFALIDWIRRQAQPPCVGLETGIGDDMAVVQLPGAQDKLLITTDMLLDGVHFDAAQADAEQIGYKAMACSLSDCAAMAAVPWLAVVAVALPRRMATAQAQQLHAGMQLAANRYQCPLVGGDTTSWDQPLAVNITMLARSEGIEPVLRSGARPGDALMVSGTLGESLRGRHLTFEPRIALARRLAKDYDIHALMDLSDGLAGDVKHICRASNVRAILESERIPISAAAAAGADPLRAALCDGEDFELLWAIDADAAETLNGQKLDGITLTTIGQVVATDDLSTEEKDSGVLCFIQDAEGNRQPMTYDGWEHFRES